MRPSLLHGLLLAAKQNIDRGFIDLALFECGQVFAGTKPDDQKTHAAGLRTNLAKASGLGRHWSSKGNTVDVFDVKADCLEVLSAFGVPDNAQITRDAPAWYHPGRSGVLRLGANVLAQFGELHPKILEAYGIKDSVAALEIFIDALPTPKAKLTKTKLQLQLSALQPLRRDFAFIVDEKIEAGEIVKAARGADKSLITKVNVFDVYKGKGIEPHQKSLAIEVVLQPQERTMTDAEIEAVAQKIVSAVTSATGATLRS